MRTKGGAYSSTVGGIYLSAIGFTTLFRGRHEYCGVLTTSTVNREFDYQRQRGVMQSTKLDSTELLSASLGTIQRFFSVRVSSIEDMEDLTQDVCCAIIDSYDRFCGASSQSTWVFAICKNHLYKYYRKKRRTHETIARLIDLYPSRTEHKDIILDMACDRLSIPQQILYNEYYRHRKPVREIAVQMNKPEGTVKYLLFVLRRDLRSIAS